MVENLIMSRTYALFSPRFYLTLIIVALVLSISLLPTYPVSAAGFIVNTTADHDDGTCASAPADCTVREAINAANAASSDDTISFSVDGTFVLSSALPALANNGKLTIQGNGAANTVIDGNHAVQPFQVSSGATVTINGVTIRYGTAADGGGIDNAGTLTLNNSTISGNSARSRRRRYLQHRHADAEQQHHLRQLGGHLRRRHFEHERADGHQQHHLRQFGKLRRRHMEWRHGDGRQQQL